MYYAGDANRSGLGYAPLAVAAASGGPVGLAIGGALAAGMAILGALKFGSGHKEADAIVPVQNAIGQRLAEISAGIPAASVGQLQTWHTELQQIAQTYKDFVNDPGFTDGRASIGGLNTIMPLIDGTGNYSANDRTRGQLVREDGGLLGAIERTLLALGGQMAPPMMSQSFGMPRLTIPAPGTAYLPEAGYIPPTAPLPRVQTASVFPSSVSSFSNLLPMALMGGAMLMFLRRRR